MLDFLDKLRARSESFRRTVAVWTTGALSVLIVVMWIAVGGLPFAGDAEAPEVAAESANRAVLQPLGALKNAFTEAGEGIAGSFGEFGAVLSEPVENLAVPEP